ncbi:AAA family ATPase [Sulfolobus sp. A20-N-F6]|nr:AAA family ATPase [Sulfolobus sp. A20-N-F6]
MYGKWLNTRKAIGFDLDSYEDENIQKIIDFIKKAVEKKNFYLCFFEGGIEHWINSIKYSLEGEIGYTLWGDPGENKGQDEMTGFSFATLVNKYREGHIKIENGAVKLAPDIHPLIGVFYATKKDSGEKSGVLGFGIVTDIDFDVYRNFKGWKEDNDKLWLVRFRIKVLYLNDSIRNNLGNPDKWSGDNIEGFAGFRTNQCFDVNKNNSIVNVLMPYIQDKLDQGVRTTLELYRSPQDNKTKTTQLQVLECKENGFKSDYNSLYLNIDKYSDISNPLDFIKTAMSVGNVLFVGPPGTGKTTLATYLVRELVGDNKECYTVTTANSLWFRRHVIGGESLYEKGVIWRSGLFIRAYNKASKITGDGLYFVVIDEINRADVDKAFGELFTMFSSFNPDEWKIPSSLIDEIKSYGSSIDGEAGEFLENYKNNGDSPLRKIRIIATMNLVDVKNLFYLGEAILRRFTIFNFGYPNEAEDVEKFAENLDQNEKKDITDIVKKLRKEFNNDGELSTEGITFNISPASVRKALLLYSKLPKDKRNVDTFIWLLRSSLGTIDSRIIDKFDEIIRRR